jgi:6-phosphofructokinase
VPAGYCLGVNEDAGSVGELTAVAPSTLRPNKFARILAAAIISSLMAVIVTKVFGRKAGFVALFVSAAAHEVMEAPLARFLGEHLGQMTE